MPETTETELIREATEIFLSLRDNPDDPVLQGRRDAFVSRGDAERSAYAKMLQVWKVTDPGTATGPSKLPSVMLAAVLATGAFFAYEPMRVSFLADLRTDRTTTTAQLASGDQIMLDASSALIDETHGDTRDVTLLQGAAFFDVQTSDMPFSVTAGELRVEVTGTSFEVAQFDDATLVSVTEGFVRVSIDAQSWQLSAGDQLNWDKAAGVRLSQVEAEAIAAWRGNVLLSDAMTFAQIASVLERRMPGGIFITSPDLAGTPVVGTFDLSDPIASLKLLAELTDARITTLPYLATIISP